MRPSWILSEEERIRRFHGRGRTGGGGKCEVGSGPSSDPEDAAPAAVAAPVCSSASLPKAGLMCPSPLRAPSSSSALGGSCSQLNSADRLRILQYGEVMRRCCAGRHDDLEPALVDSLVQSTQPGGVLTRSAAERLSTIIDARTRVCFTLFQVRGLISCLFFIGIPKCLYTS